MNIPQLGQVSRSKPQEHTVLEAGPSHAEILARCDVLWVHTRHRRVSIGQSVDPLLDCDAFIARLDAGHAGQGLSDFLTRGEMAHRVQGLARPGLAVLKYPER